MKSTYKSIRNGRYAAFFQYRSSKEPISLQRTLFLKDVRDYEDQPIGIDLDSTEGRQLLRAEFGEALRSLFPDAQL